VGAVDGLVHFLGTNGTSSTVTVNLAAKETVVWLSATYVHRFGTGGRSPRRHIVGAHGGSGSRQIRRTPHKFDLNNFTSCWIENEAIKDKTVFVQLAVDWWFAVWTIDRAPIVGGVTAGFVVVTTMASGGEWFDGFTNVVIQLSDFKCAGGGNSSG
jgi:hypothetical protein